MYVGCDKRRSLCASHWEHGSGRGVLAMQCRDQAGPIWAVRMDGLDLVHSIRLSLGWMYVGEPQAAGA